LILGANNYVHERWLHNRSTEYNAGLILILAYCGACCWGSYRRWKTLQLIDGTARELRLPSSIEAWLLRPFRTVAARLSGPLASLQKKELRIHQVSFVLAGLFVVFIALAGLLYLSVHDQRHDPVILLICGYVFYLPLLPLLVGVSAVAEEKNWGVADWQLTLPVSAWGQWWSKVFVAWAISVGLGVVLPALISWLGAFLIGSHDPADLPIFYGLRSALGTAFGGGDGELAPWSVALLALFCGLLGHVTVTSFALYSGAICSTTARALIAAVLMMVVSGYVIATTNALAWSHREWLVAAARILKPSVPTIPSAFTVLLLLAVETMLFLGLLWGCAYRAYRTRSDLSSLLKVQVPLLVGAEVLLALIFLVYRITPLTH